MRCLTRFLEVETFIHATENRERVVEAALDMFKGSNYEVDERTVLGHHGNPIIVVTIKIDGCDSEEIVRHLISRLDRLDRNVIRASLISRSERNRVYLRLDKQELVRGHIALGHDDDVVKVTIGVDGIKAKTLGMENVLRMLGLD